MCLFGHVLPSFHSKAKTLVRKLNDFIAQKHRVKRVKGSLLHAQKGTKAVLLPRKRIRF